MRSLSLLLALSCVIAAPLGGCFNHGDYDHIPLERLWGRTQSPKFDACIYASPQLYDAISEPAILVAGGDGAVVSLDPLSGSELWRVTMPAPAGEDPMIVATPVRVGDRLVVAYHTVASGTRALDAPPLRHRVAVVDLANRRLDPAFEPVELSADKPVTGGETASFLAEHQIARGALAALPPRRGASGALGTAYVAYGAEVRRQPWHGWLFELDLDDWLASGASHAVSGVLLTTASADCGADGSADNALCAGGIDMGAGPLVDPGADDGHGDDARLLVATSNGELDLARGRFANALLRVGRGLKLSTGCEPGLCAGAQATDPMADCLDSCADLFVPHLGAGDTPLRPPSVDCTGQSVLGCLRRLDPARAVTPLRVEARGRAAFVWPTPDGHVSLVDAEKLGTMYARARVADDCGAAGDACADVSAGTIVAQPALSTFQGWPLVIVSTFMPDTTHAAGLVALVVVDRDAGGLGLDELWRSAATEPDATARARFRQPSTRAVIGTARDTAVAWVVDVGGAAGGRGNLLAVRLRDGHIVVEQALGQGPGVASALPLLGDDETVTVASCVGGAGHLERYSVTLP